MTVQEDFTSQLDLSVMCEHKIRTVEPLRLPICFKCTGRRLAECIGPSAGKVRPPQDDKMRNRVASRAYQYSFMAN